jgi:3'(2'), 5'-bisphosphate nucleotidase
MASDPSSADLLERLLPIARSAGKVILQVYATDFDVKGKADDSPVTEADHRAEALILPALAELTPDIPIVSEEAVAAGNIPRVGDRFWLVDPLDGTKEFIKRNGEFTVNIALIQQGRPTLGVVLAPALDRLYAGTTGHGAFLEDGARRRKIACRRVPAAGLTVVASRSHGDTEALDRFLTGRMVASQANAGSSLKFCLVAAGDADLYPRFGRTMEWDTAAGHAVLAAAGGRVMTVQGDELLYGKPGFENPHFIAQGL